MELGIAALAALPARLESQIDECKTIPLRFRETAKTFLLTYGITDVIDIDLTCQMAYREWLENNDALTKTQKRSYGSVLETIVVAYYSRDPPALLREIEKIPCVSGHVAVKVSAFLLQFGIKRCQDIDCKVRIAYEDYLKKTIAPSKVLEYVKGLDKLKLEATRITNETNPLKTYSLVFAEIPIYLQYHPDYQIAKSLYYTNDKSELMFDFSAPGSRTVKKQIFDMLMHVLETENNQKMRHEAYLRPLKMLYQYCIDQGISDIEQLTQKQVEGFRESIADGARSKLNAYMTVIDNLREYLFTYQKEVNWQATVWYLDRFKFSEDRYNPSNPVRRLRFDDIYDEDNRNYLQVYMRYLIGLTDGAIVNVRCKYGYIHSFLLWCEAERIKIKDISGNQMETYFQIIDAREIEPATFDKHLVTLYEFYEYLVTKGLLKNIPFLTEYYYKKFWVQHNNRVVPESVQKQMLDSLTDLPYHLRLMYLTIWATGLRLSEVCTLKGSAFERRGDTGYLRIHQTKQRREKIIPVPQRYFDLMIGYITELGIKDDEFIFKNKKGGAYATGTFRKQIREHCEAKGINCGTYVFRAHDYRHTIATGLYKDGVSIQVLREYLGHRDSNMTKQYIDYLPEQIEHKSKIYFANRGEN